MRVSDDGRTGPAPRPPAEGTGRDEHRLLRIVFSGLNDIEEWKLGDAALAAAKGYPRAYPAPVLDDHGIVFIDVALDAATGRLVCHEVNGPNGVGSDALTGESSLRAESEARQTVRRIRELGLADGAGGLRRPVVTVHAHQHWSAFRTGGEFYPRVARYADALAAALPGTDVLLRGAIEPLDGERVAVVVGDVPSVAARFRVDPVSGRFEYRGRPVVFIGNPNLVPELVRRGAVAWDGRRAHGVDTRVFHAWRLVPACHDKALQQRLLAGTGIEPLPCFEAWSREEAVERTRAMLARGAAVLKPNAGSGGAGVHVVAPAMTDDEIAARVDVVIGDYARKYGEAIDRIVFPLRGFPFVRSTGYPMDDGDHLWDLRIAVLFAPGEAHVYPVSLRMAPARFDPATFHHDRDQWISNVSGRTASLLASGMDDAVLAAVGMTPEKLENAFRACVAWTVNAWDAAVRDAGAIGTVYEDDCEREAPGFYPGTRFRP